MSLNNWVGMGRLTKDIEIKQTQTGRAVTRFTLAIDSKHVKEKTNFINCTAWGKTAEFIGKYFGKGSLICITGEIVTGSYTNGSGETVYTTDVNVEEANFTGERRDSGQHKPEYDGPTGFSIEDDDIPF